jgi:tRNA 5-methylaminomethyl-2-thiouridine biosynthesis bifunctional protein
VPLDSDSLPHSLGLAVAWAGRPQWRMLATGFERGRDFIAVWNAWRRDPQRPRLLHFVAIATEINARDIEPASPELTELAEALRAQCFGLLPGLHRMVFDDGRVLLTLCIGDLVPMLRVQQFEADAIHLGPQGAQTTGRAETTWDRQTCKAVARCCRRGTTLVAQNAGPRLRTWLAQQGFRFADEAAPLPCPATARNTTDLADAQALLRGWFDPHWQPRRRWEAGQRDPAATGRCAVVGGGLAGASVAASLARRGWQVEVLDAAPRPAAGASGLPAGLLAPQLSADDGPLPRLTRAGVRLTMWLARSLLRDGFDWRDGGVLQLRPPGRPALPRDWPLAGQDWAVAASSEQFGLCGLAPTSAACWHRHGGWIRPARLVQALLAQPGIVWRGDAPVAALERTGGAWELRDAQGRQLATADLVVLAAGFATRELLRSARSNGDPAAKDAELPLTAIRGQVSYGVHRNDATGAGLHPDAANQGPAPAWPPFPVNGHGHLIPELPLDEGPGWLLGATYQRGRTDTRCMAVDDHANLQRLNELAPHLAARLAPDFDADAVRSWAGVRCATPDRLPLVGRSSLPGLWLCTAMGSRGLTLAPLCGELLAAELHAEPLPIEARLARRLDATRFERADHARPFGEREG